MYPEALAECKLRFSEAQNTEDRSLEVEASDRLASLYFEMDLFEHALIWSEKCVAVALLRFAGSRLEGAVVCFLAQV